MNHHNARDPMAVVESLLGDRAWRYERKDDRTILTGVLSPLQRQTVIIVRHDMGIGRLLFYFLPLSASHGSLHDRRFKIHTDQGYSDAQIANAARVLLHFNCVIFGSFELDHSSGGIAFRVFLPYRDAIPTPQQITWAMDVGARTLDTVMPRVEAFLEGKISLEQAINLGAPTAPPDGGSDGPVVL